MFHHHSLRFPPQSRNFHPRHIEKFVDVIVSILLMKVKGALLADIVQSYVDITRHSLDYKVLYYPDEKGYCKMKGIPKIKAVVF